jgi:hypothetical protein
VLNQNKVEIVVGRENGNPKDHGTGKPVAPVSDVEKALRASAFNQNKA